MTIQSFARLCYVDGRPCERACADVQEGFRYQSARVGPMVDAMAPLGRRPRPGDGSLQMTPLRTFETPRESDLGLRRITNLSGLSISVLPNGCVFAIEHQHERGRTLINQVLGLAARRRDRPPLSAQSAAPEPVRRRGCRSPARRSASAPPTIASSGRAQAAGVRHSVSLWLHARQQRFGCGGCEVANRRRAAADLRCDPRPGRRPRRPRLPHEQRGLRLAVHRPPHRPASAPAARWS